MTISPAAAQQFTLGVDMGGTKILASVVDPEGKIVARSKTRTHADRGVADVFTRMIDCIKKAIKKSGVPKENFDALGIGAPGPLNPDTGVLEEPPNLPGWTNVPIKTVLEKHLGIRVFLENDVNVGAFGESRMGAGLGVKDMVAIFIGTGIGGGLILDGNLYQGFNKTAGEVGHMILKPNGPVCGCGRKGCYEALAGRLALVRRIEDLAKRSKKPCALLEKVDGDLTQIRSSLLAEAWKEKDPVPVKVLKEMCHHTGLVLGGLINFLNPEMFVLGGGVIEALGGEMIPLIRQTAFEYSFDNAHRNVRIVPAMLGDDAGIVGAALLARERAAAKPARSRRK